MVSHRINNDPIRERKRDGEIKKMINKKKIQPVSQLATRQFDSHSDSQSVRQPVSLLVCQTLRATQ